MTRPLLYQLAGAATLLVALLLWQNYTGTPTASKKQVRQWEAARDNALRQSAHLDTLAARAEVASQHHRRAAALSADSALYYHRHAQELRPISVTDTAALRRKFSSLFGW